MNDAVAENVGSGSIPNMVFGPIIYYIEAGVRTQRLRNNYAFGSLVIFGRAATTRGEQEMSRWCALIAYRFRRDNGRADDYSGMSRNWIRWIFQPTALRCLKFEIIGNC